MTLTRDLLDAADLSAVRNLVSQQTPKILKRTVEPLAEEVLRLMRTDTQRALDVADRTAIVAAVVADDALAARAVWVRGHALVGVLRNQEAAACYEDAATRYRELGDKLSEARVSIGWVAALMYLGNYAPALEIGERARRTLMRHGQLAAAARLDLNLGNVHHRVERPVEALRRYDRALKVAQRLDDAVMIRVIQFNRANILTTQGKLEQAEALYRQVAWQARLAGETRTYGMAEYSLGYLMILRGEYGQAYELLDGARTVFEELRDPHYMTVAWMDLAELFVEMNGFRRAQLHGRRARTLAERYGMRFEAGRAALFQAVASLGLGENAQAEVQLDDAFGAFHQEGNETACALCNVYLAELESRRERPEEAARLLRAAGDVFARETLRLREATTRVRLALVELGRSRIDAAHEALEGARRAVRRTHSPWVMAQIDHAAGRIAWAEGKTDPAIRAMKRAIKRVESIRGRIGLDEFRLSFGEDKAPLYADLVHAVLAKGGPGATASAFEIVERSRSRALVDLLAGNLAPAQFEATPAVEKLLGRLQKLQAEVNWLSGFDPDQEGRRRNESRLGRSGPLLCHREEEIADVVQRLRAKDHALGALTAGETAKLDEVCGELDPDTTLVEYYASDHGVLAFVVTPDGARVVTLDVTSTELVAQLSRLRFQMEKWGYGDEYVRAREVALAESLDRCLDDLSRALWWPLEVTTENVIVVPHGALHSLPFHALHDRNASPLVEHHTFSYLPSASAPRYLRVAGDRKTNGDSRARVLAVGVGDRSIPQVDGEVRRVRKMFSRGRLLRGNRATKERFRNEAATADVIHVATHGVFRDDDPHFSALRFADGWMSLYEFYGLRLNARLVCVSACQSGRSWTGSGDEIVGLARGFLHAGAGTIVVSLWPVHDDSTARLMELFYAELRKGSPAEEALRQAMRSLRQERPHPYHWAPFVLIGRRGVTVAPRLPIEGSHAI